MSAPTTISAWLQGLPISWLVAGPVGSKDAASQGQLYDDNVEQLREAVLARFPGEAPSDALSHIGGDRKLIQGYAESNANFRVRLRTAWDDWSRAGTPVELLTQLYWEGYTTAVLVQQNGLIYSLSGAPTAGSDPTSLLVITYAAPLNSPLTPSPDPPYTKTIPATSQVPDGSGGLATIATPWWIFDYKTDFCSRFALILPTQPSTIDPSGNAMWTSGVPTADALSRLRFLIQTWKPGSQSLVEIIAFVSGLVWGYPPTQDWGGGGLTWGGANHTYGP